MVSSCCANSTDGLTSLVTECLKAGIKSLLKVVFLVAFTDKKENVLRSPEGKVAKTSQPDLVPEPHGKPVDFHGT